MRITTLLDGKKISENSFRGRKLNLKNKLEVHVKNMTKLDHVQRLQKYLSVINECYK